MDLFQGTLEPELTGPLCPFRGSTEPHGNEAPAPHRDKRLAFEEHRPGDRDAGQTTLRWGPDKVLPLGSRMISSLLKHSASNLEAFQSEAHSSIQEALEKDEPPHKGGLSRPPRPLAEIRARV